MNVGARAGGAGRRGDRADRPAAPSRARPATRRCATATRCSPTVTVTQQPPVRHRPRRQGQPGRAEARPLHAARERHADQPAGARVGARRQLQRRRQDATSCPSTWPTRSPSSATSSSRSTTACSARLRRPTPCPAARSRRIEAQHDAQAAVRWLRANAAHLRHRPDPDRHRRRVRRRHHRHAGRPALRGRRQQRQPRASPRPCAASCRSPAGCPAACFASAGDAPRPVLPRHGRRRRAASSGQTQTAGDDARRGRARRGSQHQEGAGHVPWAQYRSLYLEQADYFLYLDARPGPRRRPAGLGGAGLGAAARAAGRKPARQAAAEAATRSCCAAGRERARRPLSARLRHEVDPHVVRARA